MARIALEHEDSYSTFWDEAPVESPDELKSPGQNDPYADFSAATEDDSMPEPIDAA